MGTVGPHQQLGMEMAAAAAAALLQMAETQRKHNLMEALVVVGINLELALATQMLAVLEGQVD